MADSGSPQGKERCREKSGQCGPLVPRGQLTFARRRRGAGRRASGVRGLVDRVEPVSGHGLILHSVGPEGPWTQVSSPAPQTIFDVFARTPTDVWAAGSAVTDTYILRYTGTQWSRVFTNAMQINRLYMLTATDGWGMSGISGVIAHYDGTES